MFSEGLASFGDLAFIPSHCMGGRRLTPVAPSEVPSQNDHQLARVVRYPCRPKNSQLVWDKSRKCAQKTQFGVTRALLGAVVAQPPTNPTKHKRPAASR
jgi:hypothetical protein